MKITSFVQQSSVSLSKQADTSNNLFIWIAAGVAAHIAFTMVIALVSWI